MSIPIIDIFAGPGGLGEGFSQQGWKEGNPFFRICLSVEKSYPAFRTLKLRSFLRQFRYNDFPDEYYTFLQNNENPEKLYTLPKYEQQSRRAEEETWMETLRQDKSFHIKLDEKITKALQGKKCWVLIGGPPCQAYSLVGRSRNKGIKGYRPESDERHFLYQEYLRIIDVHRPSVFVMENVKGILSSKINGSAIFSKIRKDLTNPSKNNDCKYRIFSLTKKAKEFDKDGNPVFSDTDFIIKSEKYGIPQSRHRVILLGIREDLCPKGYVPPTLVEQNKLSVSDVLNLPPLRSGISRGSYTSNDWEEAIRSFPLADNIDTISEIAGKDVTETIKQKLDNISTPPNDMGGNFVNSTMYRAMNKQLRNWFLDYKINGVLNHSSRTHMRADLHRYFYAACFAEINEHSPRMHEFPEFLKPNHKNHNSGHFNDRFRVQLADQPSSTITSHIAKDGHYYIHYEARQCRSLTVREAARLQTFPDNYFFCGNRTEQYVQVGNAVPPLLAAKISCIVKEVLTQGKSNFG
ncbi:DNA cytosine methyltransferase [Desulfoluna butyratoxydans]|uniref:DNA (cytosine-5-)-methyltransferase n=1 Tax=Desulfoluna butyratoxydans TaxID=231438 RepID=A0A4U8YP21_9BACT|nr:DNA cytosine methyltransferase [Desulfoluna butyratoxydans]VFQ42973.1 s-adenosyl-l-methionine-dependent methyltransferase [Desulfoluna butyratoxydans]